MHLRKILAFKTKPNSTLKELSVFLQQLMQPSISLKKEQLSSIRTLSFFLSFLKKFYDQCVMYDMCFKNLRANCFLLVR